MTGQWTLFLISILLTASLCALNLAVAHSIRGNAPDERRFSLLEEARRASTTTRGRDKDAKEESELDLRLIAAGIHISGKGWILRKCVLSAAVLVMGIFSGNFLMGCVAAIAVMAGAQLMVRFLTRKNVLKMETQLHQAELQIAENTRSGLGIQRSVLVCAQQTDEPLKTQLQGLYNQMSYSNMTLSEGLDRMARRTGSKDFADLAAVIQIQEETGANLADTLEFLATSIASRLKVRRTLKSRLAETKLTAVITALSPVVVFLIGSVFISGFASFYKENHIGWIVLAACALLELTGVLILSKLASPDIE